MCNITSCIIFYYRVIYNHRQQKNKSRGISLEASKADLTGSGWVGRNTSKTAEQKKEGAKMEITIEQIKEAIKAGYNVTVIINGEYYDFKQEEK